MNLVGFTIEIYYDARPCERHTIYIGQLQTQNNGEGEVIAAYFK